MARKGWGPEDLADASTVGVENIKKYCQAKVAQPRGDTVARLARALDVRLEWLRDGHGPMTDGRSEAGDFAPVAEMDARASGGAGAVIEYEDEKHYWGFPTSWVDAEFRAKPSDLRILTVDGDSMVSEPPARDDLEPGDKIIVNIADKRPSPPGIFIVFDGLGVVAKRIEYIAHSEPPTIRLLSNNPRYQEYRLAASEATIIGRVVGRWQRL